MTEHAALRAPEILAPAGTLETFAAALASDADAVYLGLTAGFHARARSTAFELERLPSLVTRAHRAGKKLYVTVNTLVFERELDAVEELLRAIALAGADAVIVQDPAVALIAQRLCPELRVHASTQMTISSVEGTRFAESLGVTRVVLPRELSLKEIGDVAHGTSLETEVFLHGALCMAWSGQCLTSEALSGRSANRGQCSQACRMPYDLVVDGERRDLGDTRYLLSPRDLAAHEALPELIAAGVRGLKIEGRYKNAAYVIAAVDALHHHREALTRGATPADHVQLKRNVRRTQLTFSRGASLGFLRGDDHQTLVEGKSPKHRGLVLGTVSAVHGRAVELRLDPESDAHEGLRAGMGIVFDVGDPEHDDAPGGPIFEVRSRLGRVELVFGEPGPDLRRVQVGDAVLLTGDPELQREALRRAKDEPSGRLALELEVSGSEGAPLQVRARARCFDRVLEAEIASERLLEPARSGGLDQALLQDKLGALGGTPFRLEAMQLERLTPGLYVAVTELKRLRRALVADLEAQLARPTRNLSAEIGIARTLRRELAQHAEAGLDHEPPRLLPLCRTAEQLEAVIASGLDVCTEVELDFMDFVGLGAAVRRARQAGLAVTLATVRVQKPGEEGYDRRIAALEPDAVLVRHWGALMCFLERPQGTARPTLHGDFSLNVTNSLTAQLLLARGLHTVTASHDLDRAQLLELLPNVPRGRLAITLHHHIPTFHNSHCVYAHLLSGGRDYRSCGRPCEQHRVALRDFAGHDHPVIVDVSCRNTVFNPRAQSAAPLVPGLLERGVRRFRVELVWETREEVERTLGAYAALLRGQRSPQAVLREVGVHEQYGISTLRSAG